MEQRPTEKGADLRDETNGWTYAKVIQAYPELYVAYNPHRDIALPDNYVLVDVDESELPPIAPDARTYTLGAQDVKVKGHRICPECGDEHRTGSGEWREEQRRAGRRMICWRCASEFSRQRVLKQCPKCEIYYEVDGLFWHADPKGENGLYCMCRLCKNQRQKRRDRQKRKLSKE